MSADNENRLDTEFKNHAHHLQNLVDRDPIIVRVFCTIFLKKIQSRKALRFFEDKILYI